MPEDRITPEESEYLLKRQIENWLLLEALVPGDCRQMTEAVDGLYKFIFNKSMAVYGYLVYNEAMKD